MESRQVAKSSPQFLQRSRSGTTFRPCHVITPPFSPNQAGLTRSESAAKSRSADGRRPSKENHDISPSPSPSPRPRSSEAAVVSNARRMASSVIPSAWALSPGRSLPAPPPAERERKRNGLMGFFRKKKGVSEKEEAVHQLRMMTSRLMQWRFVNAKAQSATDRVRSSAERKLFFAWLRINEIRNIVAAKLILIQRGRHKLKLVRVAYPQLHLLKQWKPQARRHLEAVTTLSSALESMCIPLPLVDGGKADIVLLHDYISNSMDIMLEIEAAIRIFYSKTEELRSLLSELVETVRLEMQGLKKLKNTNTIITSMEMHETSLRANMIQAMKKEVEPPLISTLNWHWTSMAWRQYQQWDILV